jgi:hypothetical protein
LLPNLQDEDGEELQISQGVNMVGAMKRITLLGQREMGTKGGVDVNMTITSSLTFSLLANGRILFGALYLVRPWP